MYSKLEVVIFSMSTAIQYNHSPNEKEELGMNKNAVRFTVDLTINEGKFDRFQDIAQAMITGTQ